MVCMDGLADPERGIEGGDNTGEREHERCWKKRGGGEFSFFSSGVRFTRDIRVQRNSTYVRMYGVSTTVGEEHFLFESSHPSLFHPLPPRSLLAAGRRKTKSRRGRRHKSLNPVQRIPGSFSLFPFHPVFLFLLSVGEGRSVSSKIAALLFLRVLLEEECRCSRRNFRGAELLLIGLGMRRSSCSIVRHGISLAVYRFFFGRRVEARFDPVRFRPEFFQLCKRDSLFLTVCLSRLPPVARFIVLDLSRAFRDREQD